MWGKKDRRCDPEAPADERAGSQWDHVILDAGTKLGVSLVVGARTEANALSLVQDFAARTDQQLPQMFTSDQHRPYAKALLQVYGEWVVPERTGKPGRPRKPYQMPPEGLVYAQVHKHRQRGRVVRVTVKVVYGTEEQILAALRHSPVSQCVNTTFVERYNATGRQHNSRKQRKVYSFSKEWADHDAMSWYAFSYYNFCRPHGSLRVKIGRRRYLQRTPAMAANLTDHIWSLSEFLSHPLAYHGGEVGH